MRHAKVFLVFLSVICAADVVSVSANPDYMRADIYFNKSNPLFFSSVDPASSPQLEVTVRQNGYLHIHCPHYPSITNVTHAEGDPSFEHYKLFMFHESQRQYYDSCQHPPANWRGGTGIKWISGACTLDPRATSVAIKFLFYIPFPETDRSFQYQAGTYYVTSFSTGQPGGYNNTANLPNTACKSGLKFKVNIVPNGSGANDTPAPTPYRSTTIIPMITSSIRNSQTPKITGGPGESPSASGVSGTVSTDGQEINVEVNDNSSARSSSSVLLLLTSLLLLCTLLS